MHNLRAVHLLEKGKTSEPDEQGFICASNMGYKYGQVVEVGICISNGVDLEVSMVHIRGHKSTTEAFVKCLQEKVEQIR